MFDFLLFFNRCGGGNERMGTRKITAKKNITIHEKPDSLYRFWHDFGNLPSFISHLESVRNLGNGISQWTLKIPIGSRITWKARISEDRENEFIRWRSLPHSDIVNEGSVSFDKREDGKGTEVAVHISYEPPAGHDNLIETVLLNTITAEQIEQDLHHLKRMMEKD